MGFLTLLNVPRTDTSGRAPVMTQPWSVKEPRLNDYAGYDVTSCMYHTTIYNAKNWTIVQYVIVSFE